VYFAYFAVKFQHVSVSVFQLFTFLVGTLALRRPGPAVALISAFPWPVKSAPILHRAAFHFEMSFSISACQRFSI
jgi:hypothetical protein